MTKPNKQHQLDILYVLHYVFEGNTYNCTLRGVDIASRIKSLELSESIKQVRFSLCRKRYRRRAVSLNM